MAGKKVLFDRLSVSLPKKCRVVSQKRALKTKQEINSCAICVEHGPFVLCDYLLLLILMNYCCFSLW